MHRAAIGKFDKCGKVVWEIFVILPFESLTKKTLDVGRTYVQCILQRRKFPMHPKPKYFLFFSWTYTTCTALLKIKLFLFFDYVLHLVSLYVFVIFISKMRFFAVEISI